MMTMEMLLLLLNDDDDDKMEIILNADFIVDVHQSSFIGTCSLWIHFSENIILGQLVPAGTGSFDLFVNVCVTVCSVFAVLTLVCVCV